MLKQINPFNNMEVDNKLLYVIKILLKTGVIYFIGLILASVIVVGFQIGLGYDNSTMPFNIMLLLKYYGYIFPILLLIIAVKKFEKSSLEEIGVNKDFKKFIKGILIGIVVLLSIVGILAISNQIKFDGLNSNVNYGMFALFVGAWLVQSTVEEIICRGYLLHKLSKKINVALAIIISFMVFSVGHFFELFNDGALLGIIGCINLLLPSVIWSLMVLKDKNIYSAIGFHFIWNFSLFNIIGLNVSGIESDISLLKFTANNEFLTGASYGIEASVITTVILTIVLIVIGVKSKNK